MAPTKSSYTPIPGGTIALDTTGYPNPQPGGGTMSVSPAAAAPLGAHIQVKHSERDPTQSDPGLELYPSHAALEFSIGDLQHLGHLKDIEKLVFVVTFTKPPKAQLREFTLLITSPEGKELYKTAFDPGRDIKGREESKYVFEFDHDQAKNASRFFVPGNRIRVLARSAQAIREGKLQAAVREDEKD
jgi:hypothetical protein